MQAVVQTKTGLVGNCYLACVATVMEVAIEDLPHGTEDMTQEGWPQVHIDVDIWLRERGLEIAYQDTKQPFAGCVIWTVPSRNLEGELHVVVAKDGKQVWDPHPDAHGLPPYEFEDVTEQAIFRVLEPAAWRS